MYHIKNDRRAEKSVELIIGALTELMGEKAFSEITVTDVQRHAVQCACAVRVNLGNLS